MIYRLLLIGLCLASQLTFADDVLVNKQVIQFPEASQVIDTGWINEDPLSKCPKTHYPISLEIIPLDGDGAKSKAIFIPKPKQDLDYKHALFMPTEEYEALNAKLTKQGYIQVSHQTALVMQGHVHQSVWVISKKEK